MASRGASYREILKQYFPGTKVGGQTTLTRAVAGASDAGSVSNYDATNRLQLASASEAVSAGAVARAFVYVAASSCVSWLSDNFLNADGAGTARRTERAFH